MIPHVEWLEATESSPMHGIDEESWSRTYDVGSRGKCILFDETLLTAHLLQMILGRVFQARLNSLEQQQQSTVNVRIFSMQADCARRSKVNIASFHHHRDRHSLLFVFSYLYEVCRSHGLFKQ